MSTKEETSFEQRKADYDHKEAAYQRRLTELENRFDRDAGDVIAYYMNLYDLGEDFEVNEFGHAGISCFLSYCYLYDGENRLSPEVRDTVIKMLIGIDEEDLEYIESIFGFLKKRD